MMERKVLENIKGLLEGGGESNSIKGEEEKVERN